ncbi:MAG TPA: sodium:calcium antiporter, partial [Armatimonadetes bacterium]|nr:sodium:calcium antiporter [Armatimonadota bacterium]
MRKLYAGFIVAAVILTVPWVWSWLHHYEPAHAQVALMSGLAIVGAAFLISWGAELAQLDVSRSLAMAVLSLIAVLPEYAVDIYLAWRAGKDISYASLAAANMTGGNRLLVGIGWPLIAFCAWWALRRLKRLAAGNSVQLDRDVALEIVFLSAATIYSFLIPLKHNISLLDAVILISLYVGYVCCAIRAPHREPEFIGPVKLLASLPRTGRRAAVLLLFAYSGFVIFISAEPLAESLKELGRILGIGEFFMIQWLAPLASESPEIIVVAYFALRGLPATALTAIISAKVNQWTLLISSLPIVFSISRGAINALPLDALQVEEVLLTAAQSLFGC